MASAANTISPTSSASRSRSGEHAPSRPPRRDREPGMSERLAAALLDVLDEGDLDRLADVLAPRIAQRLDHANEWLDAHEAAEHLRIGLSRIQRLARRVSFRPIRTFRAASTRSGARSWTHGGAASDGA